MDMKTILIVIVAIVLVIGVGFGVRILFFPLNTLQKEILTLRKQLVKLKQLLAN